MALGPLFDAPGIGREPESGAIVLYALMPFDAVTPSEFAETALQFLDLARAVTARLASLDAE